MKKYKISKSNLKEFFGWFGKKNVPNKLQTIIDNTYDGKIKTKKRKTITILSPDKEFYTFTTYKEAATFLKVKLPVISIAVKKGYNINGHKIV